MISPFSPCPEPEHSDDEDYAFADGRPLRPELGGDHPLEEESHNENNAFEVVDPLDEEVKQLEERNKIRAEFRRREAEEAQEALAEEEVRLLVEACEAALALGVHRGQGVKEEQLPVDVQSRCWSSRCQQCIVIPISLG